MLKDQGIPLVKNWSKIPLGVIYGNTHSFTMASALRLVSLFIMELFRNFLSMFCSGIIS